MKGNSKRHRGDMQPVATWTLQLLLVVLIAQGKWGLAHVICVLCDTFRHMSGF